MKILIVTTVLAWGQITAQAQQSAVDLTRLPAVGELRGIATYVRGQISYVAMWSWVKPTTEQSGYSLLIICEVRQDGFVERFRQRGQESSWEQIRALPSGGFPGFIIETSEHISSHNGDVLVALVDEKFQVVYRGGTSEFVDLDGDGFPEILESSWPDGDGYPTTTSVYVWTGKMYERVGRVLWQDRLGPGTLKLIPKQVRR